MAQTGYTPILIYASGTTGNTPSAANLTSSASGAELAINYVDGKLFYKDSGGSVQVLASKGSGTIGGSNTQVQYNSSGALAGSSNLTFDGTSLTLGGNPTLSAGTANGVAYLNGSKVLTTGSALTFDGTKLGVGNTNPATTVEVSGDITIRKDGGVLYFRNTGATAYPAYITATDSTAFTLASNQNIPMVFKVNDTEQMRLTSTGLGIGTSSPTSKLNVTGLTNSTAGQLGGTVVIRDSTSAVGTAGQSGIAFTSGPSTDFRIGKYWPGSGSSRFVIGDAAAALGTDFLVLDSSGNLGLGVTPSASTVPTLQLASQVTLSSGGNSASFAQNAIRDTSWKYITTAAATLYQHAAGAHFWYTAPSGTAGNAISFTQAMTLDASGRLGVGTTSPSSPIHVVGNSAGNFLLGGIRINDTNTSSDFFIGGVTGGGFQIATAGGATRAVIDSSGNLLVGLTSNTATFSSRLVLSYNSGTTQWGVGPWVSTPTNFYISANGGSQGVYLNGASATSWSAWSDERVKTDLEPIENAATKVCSLRAVTGRYIDDDSNTRKPFLIAQDVLAVLPEAVDTSNPDRYGMSYTDTIPLLVAAIQEQQTQISDQLAIIDAQQAALDSLKARLDAANL